MITVTPAIAPPCGLRLAPIPGCPAHHAGDDGSIWSHRVYGGTRPSRPRREVWRRLKPSPTSRGYLGVEINAKQRSVHTLVLLAFGGPRPSGAVARHLDGDKTNNRRDNLAWGTYSQNNGADRDRHGTSARGERNPAVKLTDEDVFEIRRLYATGDWTLKQLGVRFGVSFSTVWLIVKWKKWTHLLTAAPPD